MLLLSLASLPVLAVEGLLTVESIATVALYLVMGAGWAYRGYRKNRALRGESWDAKRAAPALVAGALVGLALVVSGHSFDSGHVMAIAGFLVPVLDSLWNAVREATATASRMAQNGASVATIAVAVAEDIDREVDVEEVLAIVTEYERRFGTLDPDPENVKQRGAELREQYEDDGPGAVVDDVADPPMVQGGVDPGAVVDDNGDDNDDDGEDSDSDPKAESETESESRTINPRTGRPYIVEGPIVGPEPEPDDWIVESDTDGDGGDDGDSGRNPDVHETA